MAHEIAGALQTSEPDRQRRAVKEPHVYRRNGIIEVAKAHLPNSNRAARHAKVPDFVPAFSIPQTTDRDGSQFTRMLVHHDSMAGIPLAGARRIAKTARYSLSLYCLPSESLCAILCG